MEPLRVAHLNARSLNNYAKWKDLEDYIENQDIDIMTVSESWLNKSIGPDSEKYFYLQSPPSKKRGAGVLLIASRKRCTHVEPIFDSRRSRTILQAMTLWKTGDGHPRKCIVIVNYSPPSLLAESDEDLKLVLNSISSKYPREATILTGDFNRPLDQIKELGLQYSLHPMRPTSENDWYTHQ